MRIRTTIKLGIFGLAMLAIATMGAFAVGQSGAEASGHDYNFAVADGSDAITVTWDADPEVCTAGYQIDFRQAGRANKNSWESIPMYFPDDSSFVINDLDAGNYIVRGDCYIDDESTSEDRTYRGHRMGRQLRATVSG